MSAGTTARARDRVPSCATTPPDAFAEALRKARSYADSHPDRAPLITINSWNEWTETSYLMPCDKFGYGYLEAVKKVFADETR